MNEVVAYTCIKGRYERRESLKGNFDRFDRRVIFSGDSVRAGWESRPFASPPRLTSPHDVNRYHKLFPHTIFPDAAFSLYVDGNVSWDGDARELLDALELSGAALGLLTHPDGRSLRQEANECIRVGKFDDYDLSRLEHQLHSYEADGFDLDARIGANYLLVRNHLHPLLPAAMSIWWSHLFTFTKRDQMSLGYALWKTRLPFVFLDRQAGIDASRLVRIRHRFERSRSVIARSRSWLSRRFK